MIRHLIVAELHAGMTVATPVLDSDGRTLCGAGTVITERMLARLRVLRPASVAVLVEDPAAEEEAARQIRHRFRRTLDDPATSELCELFVRGCIERRCAAPTMPPAEPPTDAAASTAPASPTPLARLVRTCLHPWPRAARAVR
jgi:hypothetical protein